MYMDKEKEENLKKFAIAYLQQSFNIKKIERIKKIKKYSGLQNEIRLYASVREVRRKNG